MPQKVANLRWTVGPHGRIEIQLIEDVLLGMATAEAIQVMQDRCHGIQSRDIVPLTVGPHRLQNRHNNSICNQSNCSATTPELPNGLKHSPGRFIAPIRCKCHHPVGQRESRKTVSDAPLRLVRELYPSMSNINSLPLEAEQHGCRILNIDVLVRHGQGKRRGKVAEPMVIQFENLIKFSALQVKHRTMPPDVMDQMHAIAPVCLQVLDERDPFAPSTLHFHHVDDGVRRPEILRIYVQGSSTGHLREFIVAAFLVGECSASQDGAVARQVRGPMRKHPLGGAEHILWAAKSEVGGVRKPKSHDIQRVFSQYVFPDGERPIQVPDDPGLEGTDVLPFPWMRLC
jgi:hypothetical protein